jgi:hypothetical protein
VCSSQVSFVTSCRWDLSSKLASSAKTTNTARCLATLGNTALDGVPLDVIGVVGLDISGETVEGALDGFL